MRSGSAPAGASPYEQRTAHCEKPRQEGHMKSKTQSRRTTTTELPRDARADEILEFVYNDEEEALCNKDVVLSHQSAMPAIQEFLRDMHELDSRSDSSRCH